MSNAELVDEASSLDGENELHCPQCKNTDLDIDSSFSMQLSIIDCFDCGFHFEGKCDEETLIKRFKKKFKTAVSRSLTNNPNLKKETTMNKPQLIKSIADKSGLTQEQATLALNGLTDTIGDTLAKGEEVTLIGFGTFKVTQRQAKMGRNPATGEPIQISAKKAPVFKAGKTLKDAVNNP